MHLNLLRRIHVQEVGYSSQLMIFNHKSSLLKQTIEDLEPEKNLTRATE